MANTQVILLQRVENLGQMGEIVSVKPGFARNYLLPQQKALRANKSNIAYFEGQKKQLEAANLVKKGEAEKLSTKIGNFSVIIIRQAAEGGQLYGSVSTRDIADAMKAAGVTVDRSQISLNLAFKTIGLFTVPVYLHPEVKITVGVNIARSEEEAKIQAKTGQAASKAAEAAAAAAVEKAAFLDDNALAAEQAAEAAAKADADATAEKTAKRATKKAAKKVDEPVADDAAAEPAAE